MDTIEHQGEEQSTSVSRREVCALIASNADQAVKRYTRAQRAEYYASSTAAVIKEWVKIKSLPPVVASNPDPDPIKRSQKLSFDLVDYKIDIERATQTALEGRPDLQAAWIALAKGQTISADLKDELSWRCGRVYSARHLEPWRYWRKGTR